jgi:hypothetical protein
MEQKDYILKEIEKIGLVLKMIFNKIAGNEVNDSLALENQFAEAKGLLLQETGFDTALFLSLKKSETEQYISKLSGFNCSNIELLADILKVTGMKTESVMSKEYLERALHLYELSNSIDKTFSFDRESKISGIKNAL